MSQHMYINTLISLKFILEKTYSFVLDLINIFKWRILMSKVSYELNVWMQVRLLLKVTPLKGFFFWL